MLGDRVLIKGRLERPSNNTNFNQFNYKQYLYNNKIYYIFNIESIYLVEENKKLTYNIKNFVSERIEKYDAKVSSYLKAFILGDTSSIDSSIKENYRILGISHLLSTSGMHISLFTGILMFLLKKINEKGGAKMLIYIPSLPRFFGFKRRKIMTEEIMSAVSGEVFAVWFLIGAACIVAVLPFVWEYVLQDYQKDRILVPYVPSIDPDNSGINWQANLSKIALASGQLTGKGLYNGPQSQSDRAGKHTDFIFSVIGEELGMIACVIVILLLVIIAIRCIYLGLKSGTTLSMLVCFGVAGTILFQTFENTGMCMGITPVIGITLPFFSYGGSSSVSLFAAMGIVSGIKYKRKPTRYAFY